MHDKLILRCHGQIWGELIPQHIKFLIQADIIILYTSSKQVAVLELTIPWEDWIKVEKGRERGGGVPAERG